MSDRQLEHHLFYACVRHFSLSSVLGPRIPISRTGGWAQVGAAMVVEVAREVVREVVRGGQPGGTRKCNSGLEIGG